MLVLMAVAVVVILSCVVVVAVGRGGEMAQFPNDYTPPDLGALAATDVALLRPPTALWGYNMQATDEALSGIASALTARDVRIVSLERQLAELRAAQGAAPPAPAPPSRADASSGAQQPAPSAGDDAADGAGAGPVQELAAAESAGTRPGQAPAADGTGTGPGRDLAADGAGAGPVQELAAESADTRSVQAGTGWPEPANPAVATSRRSREAAGAEVAQNTSGTGRQPEEDEDR